VFLQSVSFPVFRITYEALVTDTRHTVKNILDFVGVDGNTDVDIERVPIVKQT